MLQITNENFGIEDPDFQREGRYREERLALPAGGVCLPDGDHRRSAAASRRNDLSTVLAQATIDGKPVPTFELFSL